MYEYKVLEVCKVVDGDTVDVVLDLGFSLSLKQRVRLAGLDAPEILSKDAEERKLGFEARDYAQFWLSSKMPEGVTIKTSKDDKYGHILGVLSSRDGSVLNDLLVHKGYAWSYKGGTKLKDFDKLADVRAQNIDS